MKNGLLLRCAIALPGVVLALLPQMAMASCGTSGAKMNQILNVTPTSDTLVIAHRGLWGITGGDQSRPENSSGALSWADDACLDGVEMDIKMTSDGIPILMHDWNLGRTTNIFAIEGRGKFDPMTGRGDNPMVSRRTYATVSQLQLLTPNRGEITSYRVPRLADILQYSQIRRMTTPIILDVKTADAVRAVNILANQYFQFPRLYVAMKVNATLYPTPAAYNADAPDVSAIPIYTTNMVAKINVHDSWNAWRQNASTMEFNVKQQGGLLDADSDQARRIYGIRIGVFQAIPDGPISGMFYKASGLCCYKLSDLYYSGPEGRDTDDERGSMNFIVKQAFGLITTDDPYTTMRVLNRYGLRRSHIHGDEPTNTPTYDPNDDPTNAVPLQQTGDPDPGAADDDGDNTGSPADDPTTNDGDTTQTSIAARRT